MRAPYLVVSFVTMVIGVWINVYHVPEHDPRVLPSRAVNESIRYSNILPNDYVGPETCAKCHQDQYQLWKEHPHHCMNQLPNADTVMGDFDDVLLTLPTGEIRFTTDDDGKYWMTITKHSELHRKYVVTRTVGSRFMQFYIGKQQIPYGKCCIETSFNEKN